LNHFSTGIGSVIPIPSGKFAVWAWGARVVAAYLLTRKEIDPHTLAVIGHSRLGKTALLAGAQDPCFSYVIGNNSGCAGASLFRGKHGERIKEITQRFPFWFLPDFKQYADHEDELPFDQHQLLALIAPRYLYVTSAEEDAWSDPYSEYLGCVAASELFHKKGLDGLEGNDPHIGYHLRSGTHYLSRYDWDKVMDFILTHRMVTG
jgi:hypothetical protein